MKNRGILRILMLVPTAGLVAVPLSAQDTAELLNRIKVMEDRIKSLEAEVQSLKAQQAATAAALTAAPPTAPAQPAAAATLPLEQAPVTLGGAGPAAAKVLNPDIAVIGDFIGAAGYAANRPIPALEMHESEVAFQEVIDPYARADFFFSFGEQGVTLEEGYITFTALPGGLQLKAGKMRAAFGRVNTMHNHVLSWVDRPLVNQDIVGGEDGIDDAGVSVSRILPAPKGIFLEGIAQAYRGDSEGVFETRKKTDVAAVGHLHAYHDFSESTNLDVGGSYARGHSPYANGTNQLFGMDFTLRWKPLRRSIYRSFVGRSELVWARTAISPSLTNVGNPSTLIRPFGYYVAGDYQFARRWFAGARFDRSQRGNCLMTEPSTVPVCSSRFAPGTLLHDTGGSLMLTYWPSEFSQIRGELQRVNYGEGLNANQLMFQFIFSMGAHGAHPY